MRESVLLDKVFEKRETDPKEAEGTGLGLAIVKTFIEAHSGAVIVESKEGCGSTFRFSLPCKVESPDGLHSVVGGEPAEVGRILNVPVTGHERACQESRQASSVS